MLDEWMEQKVDEACEVVPAYVNPRKIRLASSHVGWRLYLYGSGLKRAVSGFFVHIRSEQDMDIFLRETAERSDTALLNIRRFLKEKARLLAVLDDAGMRLRFAATLFLFGLAALGTLAVGGREMALCALSACLLLLSAAMELGYEPICAGVRQRYLFSVVLRTLGLTAPLISAKVGLGIDEVLESVVKLMPAPTGDENAPLQALIFDSFYDNYRGAICFVRIVSGTVRAGMTIRMMNTGAKFDVVEVGVRSPGYEPVDALRAGDVGYVAASIKDLHDTRVGDTITDDANPAADMLPGYRQVNPMVFCGIYPADGADYESLKDALEKLQLNDASLTYDPETSQALGFGFRCGFLGLLHMEIIQERLEREFDLDLITTAPSVIFKVYKTDGTEVDVDNPSNLPPIGVIEHMEEPFVKASIHTPQEYVGALMEVCQNKRGVFKDMVYEGQRVCLHYEMPLAEIIFDFFDQIKSRSRGYASYDYELCGYQESDLVKLDILLNGDPCDALSMIVHRDRAYARGRSIAEKLKDVIPRQMFEIPIQAAIGGKVIARETVKAMRKDVLAKCYGGDISRKRKLLEKQKEGKKRMRQLGSVQVPSEAFMAVLKMDE